MKVLPHILWTLLAIAAYVLAGAIAIIGIATPGLGLLERTLILGMAAMLIWITARLRRRPA